MENSCEIFPRENIRKIKFPDVSLLESYHQEEFDLDWKMPEALVIKYNISDNQIAAGYTDGHLIIYNLNENLNSKEVK